jgi:hypothetical protein
MMEAAAILVPRMTPAQLSFELPMIALEPPIQLRQIYEARQTDARRKGRSQYFNRLFLARWPVDEHLVPALDAIVVRTRPRMQCVDSMQVGYGRACQGLPRRPAIHPSKHP